MPKRQAESRETARWEVQHAHRNSRLCPKGPEQKLGWRRADGHGKGKRVTAPTRSLQVSFPGPHDPFLVTARMRNAASDGRAWPDAVDDPTRRTPGGACPAVDRPTRAQTRCNYAAEVENLDRLFGQILNEVARARELDATVVCVASDHGEMLGDHGDAGKSKPWEASARVPLICGGPGILRNHTVTQPVATMDLAGTFMDLASATPAPDMTTVSLRALLEDPDPPGGSYRRHVSSGLDNWRMVVRELNGTQYKYICCRGPCPGSPSTAPRPRPGGYVEILIDVVADPYDMRDLAPERRGVVDVLRPLLPEGYAKGCGGLGRRLMPQHQDSAIRAVHPGREVGDERRL